MINREATIRWKGYDPDKLSPKSRKRVWANCERCGKSSVNLWSQYEQPLDKVISCCNEMRGK